MATLSQQAKIDRELCQRSLYYLCKVVLGYTDMVPHVHGDLSHFLTRPDYGRYRQATLPRSWFKTWVCTVGGAIWMSLPDEEGLFAEVYPFKGPDARILIVSNISDNAQKMIDKIRHEWMDNDRLQAAFPELVPEFNKVRWSNECATINRKIKSTEGTYTSVGAGGGVISQHFDLIIEDDLIYAKKDDFSGQELMPNQEDIDKAVGWHKLATSLFVNPQESCLWNIGTRWAPHDLIDYIRTNEVSKYATLEIGITRKTKTGYMWPVPGDSHCNWPERFSVAALTDIREAQGAKIFETQYLHRPRAGEDVTFDTSYVVKHDDIEDFPQSLEYRTIVDLASWGDKKHIANNVILTGAKDDKNHLWIARIDAGRFNPSQVIDKIKEHQKQFNSRVLIEEVQYQRALRHFANLKMEEDGHVYHIGPMKADNRKNAKELRINALEPLVRNAMFHTLRSEKGLLHEMEDFPYSSTVDRLDCAGFLLRYAPVSKKADHIEYPGLFHITRESLEKECKEKAKVGRLDTPFAQQLEDLIGSRN